MSVGIGSYWGPSYWGPQYWGDSYWGTGPASVAIYVVPQYAILIPDFDDDTDQIDPAKAVVFLTS